MADDDVQIELREAAAAEAEARAAAPEGVPVGEPSGSPVVVMDDPTRRWMEEYARGDTTRERGGMLLGRLSQTGDGAHVTVEAAVEAAGAEERRASITFTHETWAHINAVKDSQYPDLRIVGWFHTHPGYGVFLSGYDMFIHRNFFNLPWQVAFVVDPVSGDSGFFGWRSEDVVRLPGYFVRGAEGLVAAPVPAEAPAPQEVLEVTVRRRAPVLIWGGAAAALVAIAAGVLVLAPHPRPTTRPPVGPAARPSPPAPARAKGREKPKPTPPETPEQPRTYVQMQRGDTLWGLSGTYLGDPRRYPEVQELNRIRDPRRIAQGTIVAIPAHGPATESATTGETNDGQSERNRDRRHREQGAAGDAAR